MNKTELKTKDILNNSLLESLSHYTFIKHDNNAKRIKIPEGLLSYEIGLLNDIFISDQMIYNQFLKLLTSDIVSIQQKQPLDEKFLNLSLGDNPSKKEQEIILSAIRNIIEPIYRADKINLLISNNKQIITKKDIDIVYNRLFSTYAFEYEYYGQYGYNTNTFNENNGLLHSDGESFYKDINIHKWMEPLLSFTSNKIYIITDFTLNYEGSIIQNVIIEPDRIKIEYFYDVKCDIYVVNL